GLANPFGHVDRQAGQLRGGLPQRPGHGRRRTLGQPPHESPVRRRRAVTAAAAMTTTRNGARRQASTPATRTPAGRAKPAKPWPCVSAVVATRAASRIVAAASSSLLARGGKVTRARSAWPENRMA